MNFISRLVVGITGLLWILGVINLLSPPDPPSSKYCNTSNQEEQ